MQNHWRLLTLNISAPYNFYLGEEIISYVTLKNLADEQQNITNSTLAYDM